MSDRVRYSLVLLAVLTLAVSLVFVFHSLGYRTNLTGSLPVGLYRLGSLLVARGEVVCLCLPEPIARSGVRRRYLPRSAFSPCPADSQPALKLAAALAGDTVLLTAHDLLVNGSVFASWPKYHPDPEFPVELPVTFRLGTGEIWLHGIHPYSWDSRHFGPVPAGPELTVARPVLTWDPAALLPYLPADLPATLQTLAVESAR